MTVCCHLLQRSLLLWWTVYDHYQSLEWKTPPCRVEDVDTGWGSDWFQLVWTDLGAVSRVLQRVRLKTHITTFTHSYLCSASNRFWLPEEPTPWTRPVLIGLLIFTLDFCHKMFYFTQYQLKIGHNAGSHYVSHFLKITKTSKLM